MFTVKCIEFIFCFIDAIEIAMNLYFCWWCVRSCPSFCFAFDKTIQDIHSLAGNASSISRFQMHLKSGMDLNDEIINYALRFLYVVNRKRAISFERRNLQSSSDLKPNKQIVVMTSKLNIMLWEINLWYKNALVVLFFSRNIYLLY